MQGGRERRARHRGCKTARQILYIDHRVDTVVGWKEKNGYDKIFVYIRCIFAV